MLFISSNVIFKSVEKNTYYYKFQNLVRRYHRLEVCGKEYIPENKSAIIAPNHSGSWDWDTFFLTFALPERWIHTLYWDKYYYAPFWGKYFVQKMKAIPLSLEKGFDEDLLVNEYFKKNKLVCIFPEGTVYPIWQRYKLGKFYPGVIHLALLGKVAVIPMAIIGVEEAAPVLAVYRNKKKKDPGHILASLPFILPFKIRIYFGEPIYYHEYYDKNLSKDELYKLAEEVREKVAGLISKYRKTHLSLQGAQRLRGESEANSEIPRKARNRLRNLNGQ